MLSDWNAGSGFHCWLDVCLTSILFGSCINSPLVLL